MNAYGSTEQNTSAMTTMGVSETILDDLNYELWINELPIVGLILLYMVLGCTGNGLVIYIYTISMKTKKVNRFFIPYLACVDILSLLLNGSVHIVIAYQHLKFTNDVGCKFVHFFGYVLVILSGILLIMIAYQRYVLVCKPFSRAFTTNKKRVTLASIVVCTLLISSPKFVFNGIMEIDTKYVNVTGRVCGINDESAGSFPLVIYNFVLLLTCLSCIATLSVLYTLVAKAIHARNKKLNRLRGSQRITERSESSISTDNSDSRKASVVTTISSRIQSITSSSNSDSKTKTIKLKRSGANSHFSWMFFTITMLCILTYAPRMTLDNMEAQDKNYQLSFSLQKRVLIAFLNSFYLFNSVVNPLVYGLFDKGFRGHLKHIVLKFRSSASV
ncbi:hypothetical protein FSP39_005336 [Pinctada imbricata]|uniref:G-protein coupled receptors family 1 profile domain-containing protein n=1 Tax=Pinctada imbricata TaxID=66713 RepID=A0AA88YHR8_PINIB|nr:hypothetical protein FSP39_005336 [Pinctada imbricata]